MEPKFGIYLSAWIALVTVTVSLAVYRWLRAKGQDGILHVRQSELSMTIKQQTDAQTLNRIDRWGKVLTIAAVVYGCAILAAYLWMDLNQMNR
jgi:hypothetical protein